MWWAAGAAAADYCRSKCAEPANVTAWTATRCWRCLGWVVLGCHALCAACWACCLPGLMGEFGSSSVGGPGASDPPAYRELPQGAPMKGEYPLLRPPSPPVGADVDSEPELPSELIDRPSCGQQEKRGRREGRSRWAAACEERLCLGGIDNDQQEPGRGNATAAWAFASETGAPPPHWPAAVITLPLLPRWPASPLPRAPSWPCWLLHRAGTMQARSQCTREAAQRTGQHHSLVPRLPGSWRRG